jgi:hypothetical protein
LWLARGSEYLSHFCRWSILNPTRSLSNMFQENIRGIERPGITAF